ncbi:lysophospholipid acyltransferase family protein [Aurantimonas sp. A3-2-R12]|uniref:lysophospholipid acyltransferase family protein n=1 Tax=Aurantimonas sp. A3-2-R12 TaxID=3114362 RepID=UPI002E18ED19|nr:lysophospholipid acyltransferase family protein [Aurantimonas sp. A3-2-R12]
MTSEFSYASSVRGPFKRALAHGVEYVSGQHRLARIYAFYRRGPSGRNFWDDALRHLKVSVEIGGLGLSAIPREGPVVFVANHPYGALDGIALAWAAGCVRSDARILAHNALVRIPETREHLFPIDFTGTREAERTNVASRGAALAHLKAGGAVIVFPAGAVMTTPTPLATRAEDLPWGPLTARLIARSGATVVPDFFPGQNSRLFQIASHISATVRTALLYRETLRHRGRRIAMHVGAPISVAELRAEPHAGALMALLRARTFALTDASRGRPADHGPDGNAGRLAAALAPRRIGISSP